MFSSKVSGSGGKHSTQKAQRGAPDNSSFNNRKASTKQDVKKSERLASSRTTRDSRGRQVNKSEHSAAPTSRQTNARSVQKGGENRFQYVMRQLARAVSKVDVKTVLQLLEDNTRPGSFDPILFGSRKYEDHGQCLLHLILMMWGDQYPSETRKVVKKLLGLTGLVTLATDRNGLTPLMYAAAIPG
jgi:hypothetical protein